MTPSPSTRGGDDYREFLDALTARLNAAGVPAMPSWPDAIDWLIEKANREWCGLCGGYGAFNRARSEPVPCIACGRKAEYAVLMPLDVLMPNEPSFSAPQRHGLRLIEGRGQ